MDFAVNEEGVHIAAFEGAPAEAICPECGFPVTLRRRRLMNGCETVYYWRHKTGGKLTCKARSSIITRNHNYSR